MSDTTDTQDHAGGHGLSRNQVLILLAVVLVNLLIYGGMWLLSREGRQAGASLELAVGEALELRPAHDQALALALAWQADAQLVGATTSWLVASGDRLTLQRPAWSFSFYSPAAHQMQILTVDAQGAQAGRQEPLRVAPREVAPDWNLGSDDLLLTFLSYGGEAFIAAHPNANIHLQLKGDKSGRSIWYITAVDPVAQQSLLVGVDARSRQIVE